MSEPHTLRTQVLVVGSGAGGAITAAILAEQGFDVLVVEEGPDVAPESVVTNSPQAVASLYRNAGMTPIIGRPNIAFVEGRCVGGSTEVNSGFWHRTPEECYPRWTCDAMLEDFSPKTLEPCFERIEGDLSVTTPNPPSLPESSEVLRRGSEVLGWACEPVRRSVKDATADAFAPGAKQSMQRTYLPRARSAGARVLADCRVLEILHDGAAATAATGVEALLADHGGQPGERAERRVRIRADFVFLCCGPIQTPALLRRSGIRRNVGNSLCIHPMLKAAALFDHEIHAEESALPLLQVGEFKPNITLGGSVFTPGFLAMQLSESWEANRARMQDWSRMALYYAATRGMHRGRIRALPGGRGRLRGRPGHRDGVVVQYRLAEADRRSLSIGLARLGELLFAAGAREVYPGVRSIPVLRSVDQCRALLDTVLPAGELSLSTVHAFSTCPMGENPDYCATDSWGRVRDVGNLHVNDASLIPDSPGVNPQGTTMAIALRNAERFVERTRSRRIAPWQRAQATRPRVLVTGAPGWLGTRLVEWLVREGGGVGVGVGEAGRDREAEGQKTGAIRCLVAPGADAGALPLSEQVTPLLGDLRDPASLARFCAGAEGAVLFHAAGVIHPAGRTREFQEVNVEGSRRLLEAAREAGVRRVVALSSNSPVGASRDPDEVYDETTPLSPVLGYGRSKAALEALVGEAHARGDLEGVIVRAPWFYGPGQPPRQTAFFRMIRDGRFPILGDGRQRRSMVYVDNLCAGLQRAAETPAAAGRTYWIADERPYPMEEIVETVVRVLEDDFGIPCAPRRLRLPAVLGDVAYGLDAALQGLGFYAQRLHVLGEMNRTIACSTSRAQRELGYQPRVSLREGMAASVRWCLENGTLP